jgi:hypothetical protein
MGSETSLYVMLAALNAWAVLYAWTSQYVGMTENFRFFVRLVAAANFICMIGNIARVLHAL